MTAQENMRTILEALEELRAALPQARALGADTSCLERILENLWENAEAANRRAGGLQ